MKADLTQIETDILSVLLDFSPRNQNQITDSIGKNHDNSTDRVHVHRALKNLKPFLKRHSNEIDELGKKWSLKQDLNTMRQIAIKYPSLNPELQKNEKVLSLLVENYCKLTHPYPLFWVFMQDKEKKELNDLIPLIVEEFKKKLNSSQTFFKAFLTKDEKILYNEINTIYWYAGYNEYEGEFYEKLKDLLIPKGRLAVDIYFEFCAFSDLSSGTDCKEAFNYINELKNLSDSQIRKLIDSGEVGIIDPSRRASPSKPSKNTINTV